MSAFQVDLSIFQEKSSDNFESFGILRKGTEDEIFQNNIFSIFRFGGKYTNQAFEMEWLALGLRFF